jgi:hypothetical protein
MNHKSSWLVEKRVMLLEYDGDLDKAEILRLNEDLETFLAEGEHPIHIISDNRKMGKTELTITLVQDAFNAMKKPGWGWVVLIGLNPVIRFFAEIFATQFHVNIRAASSVEEAYETLKRLDSSLRESA